MNKKRIFSGIQPSGNLHLGNYLGAIRQWTELQDEYEAVFCIVDLHAITVPQDPAELRKKTIEVAKIYLASGIDPKKSTLFIQSQISKHAQLAWILNTITKNGDLTKMTQFKSKSGLSIDFDDVEKMLERIRQWNIPDPTNSERRLSTPQYVSAFAKELTSSIKQSFNNSSVGLFDYPVLMAADILLYDTDVVPVGKDQLQHIELARTLARRFNERFGETLVIPEGKISKEGALIMGLDDPSKKMSKSAPSEYNYIALSDTPDQVRRKIMKAVTDSGSEIAYGDEKPALKNLINIYSLLSDETPEAIISKFSGKGYGDFKKDLAEVVVAFLAPLQERVAALSDEEVLKTLAEGREKIRKVAEKKMREVSEKVGLMPY
jgi:tryptophanyl-tRNA synthetase